MVNYLLDEHWKNLIPETIINEIKDVSDVGNAIKLLLSPSAVNQNTFPNLSLFLRETRKLYLENLEDVAITLQNIRTLLRIDSLSKDSISVKEFMNEKKNHEVEITSQLIVDIVKQVLESPDVHVFGELLAMPGVQELENGPNAKYYNTLNLFAYGTYKQFVRNQSQYLELSPTMKKKLQHLTIVSMAIRTKCIPYNSLLEELEIKNVRDLEDLIIEAIYADIIHGKLDQKNSQLEIDYALGRDIRPGDISKIAATLQEWCESCETVLNCLEEQINLALKKSS